MKTIIPIIISIFSILLFLSGCVGGPHSRSDIEKYLKRVYPNDTYVLAEDYIETDGHNPGRGWEVYFTDEPEYTFRVGFVLSTSFGIPKGYGIFNTFDQKFLGYYFEKYQTVHEDILLKSLHEAVYSSSSDATILAKEIQYFYDFIQHQKHPCEVRIKCMYIPDDTNTSFYSLYLGSNPFQESTFTKHLGKVDIEYALLKHIDNYEMWTKMSFEERRLYKWDKP